MNIEIGFHETPKTKSSEEYNYNMKADNDKNIF